MKTKEVSRQTCPSVRPFVRVCVPFARFSEKASDTRLCFSLLCFPRGCHVHLYGRRRRARPNEGASLDQGQHAGGRRVGGRRTEVLVLRRAVLAALFVDHTAHLRAVGAASPSRIETGQENNLTDNFKKRIIPELPNDMTDDLR